MSRALRVILKLPVVFFKTIFVGWSSDIQDGHVSFLGRGGWHSIWILCVRCCFRLSAWKRRCVCFWVGHAFCSSQVHPGRLTWNIQISPFKKENDHCKPLWLSFMLIFQGCTVSEAFRFVYHCRSFRVVWRLIGSEGLLHLGSGIFWFYKDLVSFIIQHFL